MDLMTKALYFGIVSGIVSLLVALYYSRRVDSYSINIPKVEEITAAIREGAMAFLTAEYKNFSMVCNFSCNIRNIFISSYSNSLCIRSNNFCNSWKCRNENSY